MSYYFALTGHFQFGNYCVHLGHYQVRLDWHSIDTLLAPIPLLLLLLLLFPGPHGWECASLLYIYIFIFFLESFFLFLILLLLLLLLLFYLFVKQPILSVVFTCSLTVDRKNTPLFWCEPGAVCPSHLSPLRAAPAPPPSTATLIPVSIGAPVVLGAGNHRCSSLPCHLSAEKQQEFFGLLLITGSAI